MLKAALRLSSVFVLFALLIRFALPAQAATTSVGCGATRVADLISAMNTANATTAADTIDLAAGCTYTLTAVDNTNAFDAEGSGLPTIPSTASAGTLTINGNGATIIRDSGAPDFRILSVNSGGSLTLNDLTISGGHSTGGAGGIVNFGGTLSISGSTISGNAADVNGGGVGNAGTMTVLDSTFSGNTAGTSTPNSGSGGGITSGTGDLVVTNSTFYGNSASGAGGAILVGAGSTGTVTLVNSTIYANTTYYSGGAIYDQMVSLTLDNTIIANNTVGGDCINQGGTITASHTLIQDTTNNCGLTNGTNGNIVGSDPLLGALANNGGFAQTMALLTGSPAIDAGDNALAVDASSSPLTTDEAGNARIYNGTVDLGAYEFTPVVVVPTSTPAPVAGAPVSDLCQEVSTLSDSAITVSGGGQNVTLGGVVGNTYCRLIAKDGQYVTSASEIGVQSVIDLGVVDAVDVFGELPAGERSCRSSAR